VENQGEVRFTTAAHCWDAVVEKRVYHGDNSVGIINEIIGEDVALVESSVPFSNNLLDVETRAKELCPASKFRFGDWFVLDSVFTGRQLLKCFGMRAEKRPAHKNWPGPEAERNYVVLEEGVFSVPAREIDKEPNVRGGVCGTPIIFAGTDVVDELTIQKGIVGGFMCYTDNVIPMGGRMHM